MQVSEVKIGDMRQTFRHISKTEQDTADREMHSFY